MIRTLVALFVLCSATAWAQEAGASAAEKAVSRYPDLKKLASGALDANPSAVPASSRCVATECLSA